jgi:hypothetical protein
MPEAKRGGQLLTRWEANCMFCGEELANQDVAWYEHMHARPACHEAWDHWVEEIGHDHPGG